MKLHEVNLITEDSSSVNEAKEDADFANLRKNISSRQKEVRAFFKQKKKEFIQAAAQLTVAEIGWDNELEGLIELSQGTGRDKALEKAFKNFNKNATESALSQFKDDPDIFDDMIAEDVFNSMVKEIKRVKL